MTLDEKLAGEIDRHCEPLLASEYVPGLVVGICHGGRSGFRAYGSVALDRRQLPTEHTVYETGSIGKVFTSLLLAEAVRRRELTLETPIDELLPAEVAAPHFDGQPIRLGHLASHTSALPREPEDLDKSGDGDWYEGYDDDRMWRFLDGLTLPRPPGEDYEYSNLGAGLLGRLLERSAESSYGQLLWERVTGPLGLDDTVLELSEEQSTRLAQPTAEGLPNVSWGAGDSLAAAGALRSTAVDTLCLARAHLDPPASEIRESLELVQIPRFELPDGSGVALGWHTEADGTRWHNGSTGGYHCYVSLNSRHQVAVVMMSNDIAQEVSIVGDLLTRTLIGEATEPIETRPIARVAPDRIERLVGRYLAPETGMGIQILATGDKVLARLDGQSSLRIYPESATRFAYRVVEATIEFPAGDGPAPSLTLIEGEGELAFVRTGP